MQQPRDNLDAQRNALCRTSTQQAAARPPGSGGFRAATEARVPPNVTLAKPPAPVVPQKRPAPAEQPESHDDSGFVDDDFDPLQLEQEARKPAQPQRAFDSSSAASKARHVLTSRSSESSKTALSAAQPFVVQQAAVRNAFPALEPRMEEKSLHELKDELIGLLLLKGKIADEYAIYVESGGRQLPEAGWSVGLARVRLDHTDARILECQGYLAEKLREESARPNPRVQSGVMTPVRMADEPRSAAASPLQSQSGSYTSPRRPPQRPIAPRSPPRPAARASVHMPVEKDADEEDLMADGPDFTETVMANLFADAEDRLGPENLFDGNDGLEQQIEVDHELPMPPASRAVETKSSITLAAKVQLLSKPVSPYENATGFSWHRDVHKALNRMGMSNFRANQLSAINATLDAKDVFVLMPTGGGKSLCYQLPAIIDSGKTRGLTVVVSPLLSLIQDQVQALINKGIIAVKFNSEMPAAQREHVIQDLRDPKRQARLLYVTPELLAKSGMLKTIFANLNHDRQLARFVIDEAHCMSNWGHDFRPDYKSLSSLKREFPGVPIMALTATANQRVKQDIISNLGITGCVKLSQSFNRPNLRYEVRPKGSVRNTLMEMASLIKDDFLDQCGIIYCLSQRQCEDVAEQLRKTYGINAFHYHAGMAKSDRSRAQMNWQSGKTQVICATIAFGMGIDQAAVRFVFHYCLPSSLEGYYQETGRAGRDSKASLCILYYSWGDTHTLHKLIDRGEGTMDQKQRRRDDLTRVVQFCMNRTDCRRAQVLQYFDENFDATQCSGTCDNCSTSPGDTVQKDVTAEARQVVQLMRSIGDKFTMLHCIDVFRGSKAAKLSFPLATSSLEHFGKGSAMDRGDVERLFQRLTIEGALAEKCVTNGAGYTSAYLRVGARSNEIASGRQKVILTCSTAAAPGKGKKAAAARAPAKKQLTFKSPNQPSLTVTLELDDDYFDEEEFEVAVEKNWPPARKASKPPAKGKGKATTVLELDDDKDEEVEDPQQRCYKELQELRDELALNLDCERSFIPDDVLQLISLMCPTNKAELASIEGLDEAVYTSKVAADILKCTRKHARLSASQPLPKAVAAASRKAAASAAEKPPAAQQKAATPAMGKSKTHATARANIRSYAYNASTGNAAKKGGIAAMPISR